MSKKFDLIEPFAEEWAVVDQAWEDRLREMSDDDLARLDTQCQEVTQTNCWYATYHAAHELRTPIAREQYRRTRQTPHE